MELRGLRPNTVSTFTRCTRGFLTGVGKMPGGITTEDVEGFLLELAGRRRSPITRNVHLAAIRCLLAGHAAPDLAAPNLWHRSKVTGPRPLAPVTGHGASVDVGRDPDHWLAGTDEALDFAVRPKYAMTPGCRPSVEVVGSLAPCRPKRPFSSS
jgi:hypothetical protein